MFRFFRKFKNLKDRVSLQNEVKALQREIALIREQARQEKIELEKEFCVLKGQAMADRRELQPYRDLQRLITEWLGVHGVDLPFTPNKAVEEVVRELSEKVDQFKCLTKREDVVKFREDFIASIKK